MSSDNRPPFPPHTLAWIAAPILALEFAKGNISLPDDCAAGECKTGRCPPRKQPESTECFAKRYQRNRESVRAWRMSVHENTPQPMREAIYNGKIAARVDDWVVLHGDGRIEAYNDETFQALFEHPLVGNTLPADGTTEYVTKLQDVVEAMVYTLSTATRYPRWPRWLQAAADMKADEEGSLSYHNGHMSILHNGAYMAIPWGGALVYSDGRILVKDWVWFKEHYSLITEQLVSDTDAVKPSPEKEEEKASSLEVQLRKLLNSVSRENLSNTPDFLLADYMMRCLWVFESAIKARDKWYGTTPSPGRPS